MSVPLDENDNHIADVWERSEGIYARSLPEDWDGEDAPDLRAAKGDGIALLDEYRGFAFGEAGSPIQFARLSPKTKKLFVMPDGKDSAVFHEGAVRFGAITGIAVLFTRVQLAAPYPAGAHEVRWVNFNETPWSQHTTGVRILDPGGPTGEGPGIARATDPAAANSGAHLRPQDVERIEVSRAESEKLVSDLLLVMMRPSRADVIKAAAAAGIDLQKMAAFANASRAQLVRELMVFTTIHELGHATGAVHHGLAAFLGTPDGTSSDAYYSSGDKACPMRYWDAAGDPTEKLLFLMGRWDPSAGSASGAPWRFCRTGDDDWGHLRLK